MTAREGAIVGAYTGMLCGAFSDMHAYIEEIMGRPVFTHEMGTGKVADQIKEAAKPDFIALAEEALADGERDADLESKESE